MYRLFTLLLCLMATLATAQSSETKTEVYTKGDTILVRSVTIDEVPASMDQVAQVVKQIEDQIAKSEAQLVQLRTQLKDMVRVQALIEEAKKHLPKAKNTETPKLD
jgi:cell division protein FtsL